MTQEEWEEFNALKAEYGATDEDYVEFTPWTSIFKTGTTYLIRIVHIDPTSSHGEFSAFYRRDEKGNFIKLEKKPTKRRIDFKNGSEAVAWAANHPFTRIFCCIPNLGSGVLYFNHFGLPRLGLRDDRKNFVALFDLTTLEFCTDWHVEVEE